MEKQIADEQARQKTPGQTVSRTNSNSGKTSRTESPATRQRKPKPKDDAPVPSPDPSEFENAFVIEDDSTEPSRAGTPANGRWSYMMLP